jgi:dTDP-4-amino-4,6-dideoxygalactose transaminase
MAVHFGGTVCRIHDIAEICAEKQVLLLEDAAHAQGSEWNGRRAGSFGVAGSFSFQNGKVLTAGEGGILVTSDQDFAECARCVANCGRIPGKSFYEHHQLGTNFRMTAFQAAVLLAQLERLPEQIQVRAANAQLLKDLLVGVPEIRWQSQTAGATQNSWYLLIARLGDPSSRDHVKHSLLEAGVPSGFYPHTLYQNPLYQKAPCRVMPCPVAESMVFDSLWLPHRVLLAEEESIRQIADLMGTAVRTSATTAVPSLAVP